ncbi:uroporphyrinogen-III C-methyltransferase [Massilia sp. TS11]|uniref:uroporphyrinogen-III C-methyltransferase n=1 Tax=Massilia sp. TS11 TaxID=2908003 RepID=UPI001ED9DDD6|nr:uroporphyrinogen-III C-methyltransferase [Massilia sp. TS11]MCG2584391.1 uroporphyrinogen-III C-methyltransferase [Massilia sp. TS11]
MNELPSQTTEPTPPPAAAVPPTEAAPPAPATPALPDEADKDWLQRPMTIAVGVLFVLLALQAWNSHSRISGLREDMAKSLKQNEATSGSTRTLANQVSEQLKEVQAKVNVLDSRQTEAQSQQLALEQLYQDLSKNRDEWALAEIEQVLSTASQQLQLAGNVQGALIALQNADRSLSRSDRPQFITIRRAIAKDMDRLKALPAVDLNGLAVRIDNVIGQIDSLPMLADDKLPVPAPQNLAAAPLKPAAKGKPGTPPPAPPEPSWSDKARTMWTQWSSETWADVRELIRVRSVNTPDALLVAPAQAYFVRENLKLRLLNARLGLLSRNEEAFRADLAAAQDTLNKFFDTKAKATQTAQAMLKQLQGNNLSIEMPTLAESLNAVRNYKAKP